MYLYLYLCIFIFLFIQEYKLTIVFLSFLLRFNFQYLYNDNLSIVLTWNLFKKKKRKTMAKKQDTIYGEVTDGENVRKEKRKEEW